MLWFRWFKQNSCLWIWKYFSSIIIITLSISLFLLIISNPIKFFWLCSVLRNSILLKPACNLNSCLSLFLANYHWRCKMEKVFFVLLCITCWKIRYFKTCQIHFSQGGPSDYAVLYTRGETSIKMTWDKTTEITIKDREMRCLIIFLACFSDYLDNNSIDFLQKNNALKYRCLRWTCLCAFLVEFNAKVLHRYYKISHNCRENKFHSSSGM